MQNADQSALAVDGCQWPHVGATTIAANVAAERVAAIAHRIQNGFVARAHEPTEPASFVWDPVLLHERMSQQSLLLLFGTRFCCTSA